MNQWSNLPEFVLQFYCCCIGCNGDRHDGSSSPGCFKWHCISSSPCVRRAWSRSSCWLHSGKRFGHLPWDTFYVHYIIIDHTTCTPPSTTLHVRFYILLRFMVWTGWQGASRVLVGDARFGGAGSYPPHHPCRHQRLSSSSSWAICNPLLMVQALWFWVVDNILMHAEAVPLKACLMSLRLFFI